MKHFSLEEWADFARNVVGREARAAMNGHLAEGCKECAGVLRTWKLLHEAAKREVGYQPPEDVVRTVKALAAVSGIAKGRPAKPSIAELLFDSFRQPLPGGVRSSSLSGRQLLYGSGDYRLDFRIQPREDSDKVSLLGQLLNYSEPTRPVGVVSVVLRKGKKVLAQSMTNDFGEFELEFDLATKLQLEASLPHGAVIQIPLVEPVADAFGKGLETTDVAGFTQESRGAKRSSKRKS